MARPAGLVCLAPCAVDVAPAVLLECVACASSHPALCGFVRRVGCAERDLFPCKRDSVVGSVDVISVAVLGGAVPQSVDVQYVVVDLHRRSLSARPRRAGLCLLLALSSKLHFVSLYARTENLPIDAQLSPQIVFE